MGLVDALKRWVRGQVLQSARVEVTIRGLTASCTVHYAFENRSTRAVEALYTFPMPEGAAFTGLVAEIGGQRLEAQIVAAPEAERRYEDALAEGHSALLLRQVQPGLLHAAFGNIGRNEKASFTLAFALPLELADKLARLRLPTTIRPRYGHWRLEELETPEHADDVAYPLESDIRIEGLLADSGIRSPSHRIAFRREEGGVRVVLEDAWLDGDVVLEFALEATLEPMAECFPDGDGFGLRLDMVLPELPAQAPAPLQMALVLDCSGSMDGDAIAGCRYALLAVAKQLGSDDRIQVLRFGSEVHALLRRPMRMTEVVRRSLGELADVIRADLGGTEMGVALDRALEDLSRTRESSCTQAVFLVTDGAVQPEDIRSARERALGMGIRIFVVAVGSSAAVDTLAPLARDTLGQLEPVMPGQSIASAVLRQLRRMRQSTPVRIGFAGHAKEDVGEGAGPAVVLDAGHAPGFVGGTMAAYAGDAIAVQARFAEPLCTIRLTGAGIDGALTIPVASVAATADRRALLGLARYTAAESAARRELALAYGLLTAETSAIVVCERAEGERFDTLPEMQVQPQMPSRGMARVSRVPYSPSPAPPPHEPSDWLDMPAFAFSRASPSAMVNDPSDVDYMIGFEEPEHSLDRPTPPSSFAPGRQRELLERLLSALRSALVDPGAALDRTAVLARIPEAERVDMEDFLTELIGEAPEGAAWWALVDRLMAIAGGLDAAAEDRLAEALLAAGYLGETEGRGRRLAVRLESLLGQHLA